MDQQNVGGIVFYKHISSFRKGNSKYLCWHFYPPRRPPQSSGIIKVIEYILGEKLEK